MNPAIAAQIRVRPAKDLGSGLVERLFATQCGVCAFGYILSSRAPQDSEKEGDRRDRVIVEMS